MTPEETSDLLRYAASLDRWLKESDREAAQMMVAGWTSVLLPVPKDLAMAAVRDHYAQPEARTIQPGDILGVWRDHVSREQRALDVAAEREDAVALRTGMQEAIAVGNAGVYLAAMHEAIAQGLDPSTVTPPAGVRIMRRTPEQEARERRCVFHTICVCTHLECWAGFLDQPTTITNAHGKVYPAVARCPRCDDAVQMAQERGLVKRPRRMATR